MDSWLQENKEKNHWTVTDCFPHSNFRINAFTHRNYQIGMHTHEFIELNLVFSGKGRHFMEGTAVKVSTGNAMVIPPMIEHGYIDDGGLNVCHVLIHPGYITDNLEKLRWLDGYLMFFTVEPYFRQHGGMRYALKLNTDDFNEIINIFRRLETECNKHDFSSNWASECLCSLLIIQLCKAYVNTFGDDRTSQSKESPQAAAIMSAIKLVSENPGIGINLNRLAKEAKMERSYFCRVFKRITGMSPMEFVRDQSIREAVKLLQNGQMNVGEIAMELGYSDTAHFSRSFLSATGRNPSEYRPKNH